MVRWIGAGVVLALAGCHQEQLPAPEPDAGAWVPCTGERFLCCEQSCTSGYSYLSACSGSGQPFQCKGGDVPAGACGDKVAGRCGYGGTCPAAAVYEYPGCPDDVRMGTGFPNWDTFFCAWRSILARYGGCSGADCVELKIEPRCGGLPMCGYPISGASASAAALTAELQAEIDRYCLCAGFVINFAC